MTEKLAVLKGRTFLLGVGAQKAGTTWLYYYLWKHPEVFISPIKEMHFFGNRNTDDRWPINMFRKKLNAKTTAVERGEDIPEKRFVALRERIRMGDDPGRYRRFFRKRVTTEKVFGEITPAYSFLTVDELEFVLKEYPSTKVIFLMRNPADRLWSQMRFSEQFETLDELEDRIDHVFNKRVYTERYDYVSTMRNLRTVFPPNRLHFEFYERLFTSQAIDGICDFLDVSHRPARFERSRNVSVKMPLSPQLRLKVIKHLLAQYEFVRDVFSGDLPQCWLDDMQMLKEHSD